MQAGFSGDSLASCGASLVVNPEMKVPDSYPARFRSSGENLTSENLVLYFAIFTCVLPKGESFFSAPAME
jgi:hypothetical protein